MIVEGASNPSSYHTAQILSPTHDSTRNDQFKESSETPPKSSSVSISATNLQSDSIPSMPSTQSSLTLASSPSAPLTSSSTEIIVSKSPPTQQSRDSPIDIHNLPVHLHPSPLTLRTPALSSVDTIFPHGTMEFSTNRAVSCYTGASALGAHVGPSLLSPQTLITSPPLPASISPTTTPPADDSIRTPNVYINGLPPNCPEDELHKLASQFGEVISVRTFTRHVSDKPSGYGFVLFHAVESAERCIEVLRKERHLHPSFSKRVHKIPGTQYANVSQDAHVPNALSTSKTPDLEPDGFKANMERLKDPNSTNLYMEGLPLSINEDILAALVSPYKIMSSRLFQTRLSNPPRMIAFVRLETRSAAEEVVERLHGRMVRGWNDPGCRISVRFADTSEQRELRRNERLTREGDQSPARLTVAGASLLNMTGTQGRHLTTSLPPSHSASSRNLGLPLDHFSPANFTSPSPPIIGTHHFEDSLRSYRMGTPNLLVTGFNDLSPHFSSLSYGASHTSGPQYQPLGSDLKAPQDAFSLKEDGTSLRGRMAVAQRSGGAVRAHHGYTTEEQNLIQAQLRRQSDARAAAFGQGVAEAQRPPKLSMRSTNAFDVGDVSGNGTRPSYRLADFEPAMSEADFHAGAANYQAQTMSPPLDLTGIDSIAHLRSNHIEQAVINPTTPRITLDHINARISFNRQRNQTDTSRARTQSGVQPQAHTRSTTLPPRSLNPSADGVILARSNIVRIEDTESSPRTQARADSVHDKKRMGGAVETPPGSSERSLVVCPPSEKTVDASQHDGLNTRTTESRGLKASIHSHREISDSSRSADSHAGNSENHHAQTASNTMTESANRTHHTPTADLSVPTPDTTNPLVPHNPSTPPSPSPSLSISPTLTNSTRTPATMSPCTPFESFPEPYSLPSAVVSGQAEVGLGVQVSMGQSIKLQIAGEDEKGSVDAAAGSAQAGANLV